MSKWQPIETAPIPTENGKDSYPILIWDGVRCAVSHCTYYKPGDIIWWIDESYGYNENGQIYNPTHWMPLPEPPSKETHHGELEAETVPVCGGEADLESGMHEWWVKCTSCDASTKMTGMGKQNKAIEAWQARTPEITSLQAKVDAYKSGGLSWQARAVKLGGKVVVLSDQSDKAREALRRISDMKTRQIQIKNTYGEVDGKLEIIKSEKIDCGISPVQFGSHVRVAEEALAVIDITREGA